MPKRYNVSGHDLVVGWGTGVVHHGDFVENDDADLLPTLGGDWSDDPADAQRSAVAGADVLSDEEKAAYVEASKPEKRKRGADPAPDVPAPDADAPVDTPQEG